MNWLFPGFFAATALIGLPVLLHFLRSKPKMVMRFPTLRFLGESAIRDTRKHRLRRWLTLLLRCLIIALLAAAFARPFWINASAERRRVVVIAVDNSMSMQVSGRWEEMRNWALRQFDESLDQGDQAALLLMHPKPVWLVPMTDDIAHVRSALLALQPGFEKTHYAAALRVGGEVLAANPAKTKTLVWMADEQRIGWLGADLAKGLPPGVELRLGNASPVPKRQAAIVSLKRSSDSTDGVTATLRLFSPQKDQRRITVRAGQSIVSEQSVALHSGDNKIELPYVWPKNADGLRVTLDADDLPADDTAWIASQKSTSASVLLDSVADPDFLSHALRSTQKLETGGLKTEALPTGPWPVEPVVIVRNASTFHEPTVKELDKFVAAGGPLWIVMDGSADQAAWLKKLGVQVSERATGSDAWHLRDWDPEHPVLSAFSGQSLMPLLSIDLYSGFNLDGETLVPIANWPDGKTAIAEWSGGGRRILLTGFALGRDATNWPALPSFVPFVHQAVRWLGSFTSSINEWRVGDVIPLPGPGVWRTLEAATPQSERKASGSIRPEAPGLYEFVGENSIRKVFAVNAPTEESDLSPWPKIEELAALEKKGDAVEVQKRDTPLPLSEQAAENQQRLWWWVLAICGVAILGELALSNRTAM